MNGKDLFKAIGMIDDDLILDADREAVFMKTKKFKAVAIIAAAVVTLGAATGVMGHYLLGGRSGYGSIFPDYTSVPSAETLKKDVGFEAEMPEEFSSGYTFKEAGIMDNEDFDTDGNSVESFKSVHFDYVKDGDEFSIYVDAAENGGNSNPADLAEEYNGVGIYYYSYVNKLVPGDYKLTEQDKKDEAEGKYVFSFGNPEGIDVKVVQGLSFTHKGLNYDFCAIDSPLTRDELIQIAKEIIDKQ